MSLNSIIQKAVISLVLAVPPMISGAQETASEPTKRDEITAQMNDFLDDDRDYRTSPVSLETVIEYPATEPVLEMPELTRKYKGYFLTEEEYSQVRSYMVSGRLKKDEIKQYLGFVSLMRHEKLINFVASYYDMDPMSIFHVINQESAFQIKAIGPFKERGLGQHTSDKAKLLINKVTDPESELYYPYLERKNFTFTKLSKDYKLDIIMIAAGLKVAECNLEMALEEEGMTRGGLAGNVKELGSKSGFSYLKKGDNTDFKFYRISKRFVKRMNKLWKSYEIDEKDLTYMAYNGGKNSVHNLLRKRIISEVLLINLTNYSGRKYIVDNFLDLYYDLQDEETK